MFGGIIPSIRVGRVLSLAKLPLNKDSYFFILLARSTGMVPFSIVSIVSGINRVPIGKYVLFSLVGALPLNFIFSYRPDIIIAFFDNLLVLTILIAYLLIMTYYMSTKLIYIYKSERSSE